MNFCENRIASLHHVTNLQTVLQKLVKSVTLSSQNHEKVQRSNYKTAQTQALLGALITKPHQFRCSPPMSSHKRRKFGHFSTISVILISYKQKTTILYILYIYKTKKKEKRKRVTLFDAPSQTAQFRRIVRTLIFDALKV